MKKVFVLMLILKLAVFVGSENANGQVKISPDKISPADGVLETVWFFIEPRCVNGTKYGINGEPSGIAPITGICNIPTMFNTGQIMTLPVTANRLVKAGFTKTIIETIIKNAKDIVVIEKAGCSGIKYVAKGGSWVFVEGSGYVMDAGVAGQSVGEIPVITNSIIKYFSEFIKYAAVL